MGAHKPGRWAAKLAALDVNLLVALDALLQEGNVTRAAARVGVTQSAMSQTLGRLRTHFDDALLTRVGRQMEITPFARRIRTRLHAAIAELEAVVCDRPTFEPEAASRRFVIASVDYLSLLFVPSLQRIFSDSGPGLELAVYALDVGPISAPLQAGVADLYLGVQADSERGLNSTPLFQESFCLLVHSAHPLGGSELSVQDYADFPHVHVSPRRETGTVVGRALAALGLTRQVAVEVPYFSLVPALLQNSPLVATVPRSLGRLFAEQYGLCLLDPPLELPQISICMAWDRRFQQEPGHQWLRETVTQLSATL